MPEVVTPHKHVMSKTGTKKVPLYDVKLISKQRNELLVGYDIFTFKLCACGFKEPIKVERNVF